MLMYKLTIMCTGWIVHSKTRNVYNSELGQVNWVNFEFMLTQRGLNAHSHSLSWEELDILGCTGDSCRRKRYTTPDPHLLVLCREEVLLGQAWRWNLCPSQRPSGLGEATRGPPQPQSHLPQHIPHYRESKRMGGESCDPKSWPRAG